MIDTLFSGILNIINQLTTFVLSPIDTYLQNNIPAVASLISSITAFFDYILDFVKWACSAFGLDSTLISAIFGYLIFKVIASWTFYSVKKFIKFFNVFKL